MKVAPLGFTDEQLAAVRFDDKGLVAAIVQDVKTRDVLMLGFMDQEALRRTLTTGPPGSGAVAASSTGARGRHRAIASGCGRPRMTAMATRF